MTSTSNIQVNEWTISATSTTAGELTVTISHASGRELTWTPHDSGAGAISALVTSDG